MQKFYMKILLIVFILPVCCQCISAQISKDSISIQYPSIIINGTEQKIHFHLSGSLAEQYKEKSLPVIINGKRRMLKVTDNRAEVAYTFSKKETVKIECEDFVFTRKVHPIPLWLSIIPPLLAILIALFFREVFTALFTGIFSGTLIIYFHQDISVVAAVGKALFAVADTYVVDAIADKEHISIIIFSMLIGGMVTLITRNGGMAGIVNRLSKSAKTALSGQFMTWLLGIAIFFDDYANTLVVGNTMRSVTDKLRISREKLSYIVDSTAAPISAIAFISTWIGVELSYIQSGADQIDIQENAYSIFLNSLQYSFYPIFALIFILFIVFTGRDYGPMYKAERKTREKGTFSDFEGEKSEDEMEMHDAKIKPRSFNALIPILIIVTGTLLGLLYTGSSPGLWNNPSMSFSQKLSMVIGNSDPYNALIWASLSATVAAIILTLSQRLMNLQKVMNSLLKGYKTMLTAVIILVLAWSLALITDHLHTADFISQSLISINLPASLLPALTFILAALIAFSTGTSWGTMAILYPLVLPTAWILCETHGLPHDQSLAIFYNVVSTVLAGAVMGDHCSPISDTTILSSLASSCNHIDHVRTQLPYALTVGGTGLVIGTIPAGLGVPGYIIDPVGLILLFVIVRFMGKRV